MLTLSRQPTKHMHAAAGKRRLLQPIDASVAAAAAAARAAWLQDCMCLLLAVLALDRFADYVSDAVRRRRATATAIWLRMHHVTGGGLLSEVVCRALCFAGEMQAAKGCAQTCALAINR